MTATIEGASRSTVTDGGVFSWTANDAIAVGNSEGEFTKFICNENGTFKASESIVPTGYAVYPYNEAYTSYTAETLPTILLETNYTYGSTNAPMLATISEASTSLEFKHLAGLMRFKVKNVPANATTFTLTADKGITGKFSPTTTNGETSITALTATDENKSVSITFAALATATDMSFYVPMPTGEYTSLKVAITGNGLTGTYELASQQGVTNEITRGKLLLMPTMICDDNGITLEESSIVSMDSNEEVSLNVNDGDEVVVEITEGSTATLNLTAPANSTEALTISDGSEEGTTSNQTSAATLNVSAANTSSLVINAPTLTVNLTSGVYTKVEALTAQNTLIIGNGVTIDELVVKGGNVTLGGNLTLKEPIEVNQDLVLDLGGYTLTAESSGIIVKNGTLTIKNGTLSAANTGSDAISIQGETDATIVVNVESDATLTAGDCCIVVPNSNKSENVTITTAGILDAKGTYNAIQLNGNAKNGNLNVTGGKITSTDDDAAGIYYPCDGTLTISAGEITGATAVYVKSGNLNITGGTLVGNGTKKEYQYWGNGCHTTGEALVIDNCNYPYPLGTLSVSGGTFSSTNANAVGSYYGNNATEAKTSFITGGTFSDPSVCYHLGANANVTVNIEKDYTGAGFKTTSGQTVAMAIASGKTYTVTAPLVGSAGTQTLGFQFKQGSTVTINGSGTITSSEAKMLINNYADLTLNGVTLTPSIPNTMNGQTYYVLSNNCGTVNIEGGTTITAPTSSDATNCPTVYAFDVCKYASYPNVTVNVKDATITGNVEYTGAGTDQKLNISGGTITGDLVVADAYQSGALAGGIVITGGTQSSENWTMYTVTDPNDLIGVWGEYFDGTLDERTNIKEEGTYDQYFYKNGSVNSSLIDEKWSLTGKILKMERVSDNNDHEYYYIKSITDTEMTLCGVEVNDGNYTIYPDDVKIYTRITE